jgi:tetratricopeptide (TPR) repeat protein
MRPPSQLPSILSFAFSCLACALALWLAWISGSSQQEGPDHADGGRAANMDLAQQVAEVRNQQQAILRRLEQLATSPAMAPSAGVEREAIRQITPEQVAAAVEAYLARRGAQPAEAAVTALQGSNPSAWHAELRGKSFWAAPEAWRAAFASGRMKELLAEFEAAAAANPRDATTQLQLADAYLAYVQMDPTKYQYSMKADEVFDQVLQQEPGNWQARFQKAVSYTFWPDFLGKKTAAIEHFEKLIEQQQSMPLQPEHAQVYLYYGNLLEARDPARARAAFQRGLQRHPDNHELRTKLGL